MSLWTRINMKSKKALAIHDTFISSRKKIIIQNLHDNLK